MEAGGNRQHGREGDDDIEDQAQRERAKKAFERLKSVSAAMGTREMSRTAQRLSRWANPTHMQWKDINEEVSKNDVKEIWPCSEAEIKKGRWKVSKCRNEEIKAHAETITTEVYGHALHNGDAPLYLAKMLYMHYHLRRPVDFSSKDVVQSTAVSRADTVTLTSEELALALEGAQLKLLQEKEELRRRLAAKELEAQRILQSQSPQEVNARMEERMRQMRAELQSLSQRLPSASNHLMNIVLHPEAVMPPLAASSSNVSQCPSCRKAFDSWSGYYMLACGHYYHLACLVRLMVLGENCTICGLSIPIGLYKMLGLQLPVPRGPTTSSVIRDLHFDEQGDNQSQQRQ